MTVLNSKYLVFLTSQNCVVINMILHDFCCMNFSVLENVDKTIDFDYKFGLVIIFIYVLFSCLLYVCWQSEFTIVSQDGSTLPECLRNSCGCNGVVIGVDIHAFGEVHVCVALLV